MHLLLSVCISLSIVAIAILSVQNATAVSVKLFIWQSVEMPVGIVLAFSLALGLLLVALTRPLWLLTSSPSYRNTPDTRFDSSDFDPEDGEDWS